VGDEGAQTAGVGRDPVGDRHREVELWLDQQPADSLILGVVGELLSIGAVDWDRGDERRGGSAAEEGVELRRRVDPAQQIAKGVEVFGTGEPLGRRWRRIRVWRAGDFDFGRDDRLAACCAPAAARTSA
jgi:hypothetical protein